MSGAWKVLLELGPRTGFAGVMPGVPSERYEGSRSNAGQCTYMALYVLDNLYVVRKSDVGDDEDHLHQVC
jgi:hypothetical protein